MHDAVHLAHAVEARRRPRSASSAGRCRRGGGGRSARAANGRPRSASRRCARRTGGADGARSRRGASASSSSVASSSAPSAMQCMARHTSSGAAIQPTVAARDRAGTAGTDGTPPPRPRPRGSNGQHVAAQRRGRATVAAVDARGDDAGESLSMTTVLGDPTRQIRTRRPESACCPDSSRPVGVERPHDTRTCPSRHPDRHVPRGRRSTARCAPPASSTASQRVHAGFEWRARRARRVLRGRHRRARRARRRAPGHGVQAARVEGAARRAAPARRSATASSRPASAHRARRARSARRTRRTRSAW